MEVGQLRRQLVRASRHNQVAAFDCDIDAAKIMLLYVSDINASGDNGCTPLHYAVLHRQPEMAKFLIQNGADINSKDDYGDTPIDYMENKLEFDNFSMV